MGRQTRRRNTRGLLRRRFAVVGASVGLLSVGLTFGATGLRSLSATADPLSGCTSSTGVIVAVDFAEFSAGPEAGSTYVGCAPTPSSGTPTTGYTALGFAGFTTAGDQHDGNAFICRIGVTELPNSQEPTVAQDPCIDTPPVTADWSYWHANAGATTWTFSSLGAASYQPVPGSIDAWAFGANETKPSLTPQQVRAESGTVPTNLTVTATTLPEATAGVTYSQSVAVAGGVAPYTFTIDPSSQPPPGLSLSSGGVLSGIPTQSGTTTFAVDVEDSAGNSTSGSLVLTVAGDAPSITSSPGATFTAGSSGSFTVTTSGHPTSTLSKTGTLPGGVTFVDDGNGTATVSGTPGVGATGSYPITIGANNGVSPAASQSFTLTVVAAGFRVTTSALPDAVVGTPYDQQLTATGGVGPYKWKKSASLPRGITLSASGQLSGTPSTKATGPATVEVTVTGTDKSTATASIPLAVDEAPALTSAAAASFDEGVASLFTVTTSGYPVPTTTETGPLPTGVTFSTAGLFTGTPTQSGAFPVTITADNGVGADATQLFTLTVIAPLTVATTTIPGGTPGTPYPATSLQAAGGTVPYKWKKTTILPKGLKLSAGGVLSGTLNAAVVAGTYPIGVQVSDKEGKAVHTADATVDLVVN